MPRCDLAPESAGCDDFRRGMDADRVHAVFLLRGQGGYKPYFVEGSEPGQVHHEMASTLDTVTAEIRQILAEARTRGFQGRPAWPMIILHTPKGWTCPPEIDGKKCEGYWRAHQVPMGDMDKPEHIKILERWMKSYRPEELFDANGKLSHELAELAPKGHRRRATTRTRMADSCCVSSKCLTFGPTPWTRTIFSNHGEQPTRRGKRTAPE